MRINKDTTMISKKPEKYHLSLWFSVVLFFVVSNTLAGQLAFPGAEGFGRNAVGGRGGDVYHVTNLNDSGPGSFRDAVSVPNRTVVFDASGIILIKDRIVVSKNITIAGQTAPGGGITVYGNGLSFSGADNAVVRYMRFRMGKSGDKGKDTITIATGSNMIFDHVSVSWGRDETFSISGEDGLFTIQDSIIAQGLDTHSCGGLLQNWGGISILRTLYIDNHTRNPKVKGVNQFVNNVVYNWRAAGYILGDSSAESHANVYGNYYISGPQTGRSAPFSRANENFHLFAENNFYDANANGILDGAIVERNDYGPVTWQTAAYEYPPITVVYTPSTAYKMIISAAGASLPQRDRVDQFLIRELTTLGERGRIIADEKQLPTKGPGPIAGGKTTIDTDRDGIPDVWENASDGLNLGIADNNGDIDGNGYTNLEDYLNWRAVPHLEAAKNSTVVIDLRQYTDGFDKKAVYTIKKMTHGNAALKPDGHTVEFTPEDDYTGPAALEYRIDDGDAMSGNIHVLIAAPSAEP